MNSYIPETSYVVEMMMLANHHDPQELEWDREVLDTALTLVHSTNGELDDFENVTPYLVENNCDASIAFGRPVTQETDDAYAAYLCYCT